PASAGVEPLASTRPADAREGRVETLPAALPRPLSRLRSRSGLRRRRKTRLLLSGRRTPGAQAAAARGPAEGQREPGQRGPSRQTRTRAGGGSSACPRGRALAYSSSSSRGVDLSDDSLAKT